MVAESLKDRLRGGGGDGSLQDIPLPGPGDGEKDDVPKQRTTSKTRVRARRGGQAGASEPVPALGTVQAFCSGLFNLIARLVGSTTRFDRAEFKEMAEGVRNAAEALPPLRLFLKWGSLLAIADLVVEKMHQIRNGRVPRGQRGVVIDGNATDNQSPGL